MVIIKIRAKEKVGKFLGFLDKYETNDISIYYNIEENSFYYKDKNKDIKTKKDFSRSIELLHDIVNRLNIYSVEWDIIEDNVSDFLNTSLGSLDLSIAKTTILGTRTYNIPRLLGNLVSIRANIDVEETFKLLEEILKEVSVEEYKSGLNNFLEEL